MSTIGARAVRSEVGIDVQTYRPPETGLSRLEIRDPVTQGRLAWGYISDDESLIMSNTGEVWVRHGPREVFGSEKAAEDFMQERKFMPPPTTCLPIRLRPVRGAPDEGHRTEGTSQLSRFEVG